MVREVVPRSPPRTPRTLHFTGTQNVHRHPQFIRPKLQGTAKMQNRYNAHPALYRYPKLH